MSTFLLVPGAGGDPWYWHRVAPLLERRGHRVVAVALPTGDESAGLDTYADAVVAAGTGLGPVTLVAQSMGAYAATMAIGRGTGLEATGLVLVNAMVPAPGETPGEWWDAVGQPEAARAAARAEGRPEDLDPVRDFFHDVPDEVREEAFARGEPQQTGRPFGDPWPLGGWPDVPTRAIGGRDDRLFPLELQRRLARDRVGTDLEVVDGGHLVALAWPGLLVDRLV